jgi:hypothetical protein
MFGNVAACSSSHQVRLFFFFPSFLNLALPFLAAMANEHTVLIPKEPPPPYTYSRQQQHATSSACITQHLTKPTFRQWLDSKMVEHDTMLRRFIAAIMIATIISSAVMLFLWRLQQLENNPDDAPPSKFPTHHPWYRQLSFSTS